MSSVNGSTVQKEKLTPKDKIRSTYGENHPITGEYDPALAAKCRNGTFVGRADGTVTVFRGIPFAQPPVGALRWKRSASPKKDAGVYEAYYNGKSPIQTEWTTEQASYYPQGEDCLYLNVWVNRSCDRTDKPVMVFFHGGSYGWGGTADPLYDGAHFVEQNPDIVLVTAAYRTGLMGFVDLSYFVGGENYPDAPNLGILDQIESLRWVRKNIAAFGGDPDNVTIFGESAGGGSVSLLPIIPEAKGLINRVIAESGSVALTFSKKESREFTRRLMKESGIRSVKLLTALTEEQLMTLNEKLNAYNNFPQRDGRLIPENPYQAYEDGATADVDLLIGTNADETNYWVAEIGGIVPYRLSIPVKFENDYRGLSRIAKRRVDLFMEDQKKKRSHVIWCMSEFYDEMMFRLPAVKQAECHAANGGTTYMYYWTQPSTNRFCGACHAVELSYVFGNLDETIYTGERGDERLSRLVMTMWANFARCGDPSVDGLSWPRYDSKRRYTMQLCVAPKVCKDILPRQRKMLFPLLRYMINPSYATLDYNVPFVRRTAGLIALGVTSAVALGVSVYKFIKND